MPRANVRRLFLGMAAFAALALISCSHKDRLTFPFAAPNPTSFPDPYTEPTWYPTGRAIVFNCTPLVRRYWDPEVGRTVYVFADSLSGLWIVNADGSNPHPLTQQGVQSFFSWSPDGKEIAYVKSEYADTSLTKGTIWIVNVETGVKRQLTYNSPSN